MLDGVLLRYDLADAYPFVVPIARKLFDLRSALAHSIDDMPSDAGNVPVLLHGIRNARFERTPFELGFMDWLACPVAAGPDRAR